MASRIPNIKPRLPLHAYTIGWICCLPVERAAGIQLLDEEHEPLPTTESDPTLYTLGRIAEHNVVIACLPAGLTGPSPAAVVATHLVVRFESIKLGLLVGIGGGVPSGDVDIRLGDVVVSQPENGHGGVIHYDPSTQQQTSHLDKPPNLLLNALSYAQSNQDLGRGNFLTYVHQFEQIAKFNSKNTGPDQLFQPSYVHIGRGNCRKCNEDELVERDDRLEQVQIHAGTIASANTEVKDALTRDRLLEKLGGKILCFEKEAAGLMNSFPCLVIRGICHYADTHKNDKWHGFAAATAAAYAKEILSVVPSNEVAQLNPILQPIPWLMPFPRNAHFTGRTSVLEKLNQYRQEPETCPRIAIYGLGGSGKSAIAIEFVYQIHIHEPQCAIFWVSAINPDRFRQDYRKVALQLGIPGAEDPAKDILQAVKEKLSENNSQSWLMIIDNVDILYSNVRPIEDTPISLIDCLPFHRLGTIIFTTRTREIAFSITRNSVIRLEDMNDIEAQDLLQKTLMRSEKNVQGMQELVEDLLCLPLAIIQAASYMSAKGTSIAQYRNLYRNSKDQVMEMLDVEFSDPTRDKESRHPVAVTWYISFEQIQQQDSVAVEYLSLVACIAQQNIPHSIFPPYEPPRRVEDALGMLTAYSFLTKRTDDYTFDTHALVHQAMQRWLKHKELWEKSAKGAINRLSELIPFGGHEGRRRYIELLPHAAYTMELSPVLNWEHRIDLLHRVARCEHSLGRYRESERDHRQVYIWRQEHNGVENEQTLTSMHETAFMIGLQGKYAEAEQLHRDVLALSQKVFGPEHPSTLTSMHSVAQTMGDQGKYAEAEQLHQHVLALSQKVLGPEHPETLTSMHNVAQTMGDQGKYAEAEQLHRDVLALKEKVLGPEHPETLTSMSNVAQTMGNQGKYAEAEQLHRDVLALKEKVLGPEHPSTLTSMDNVAQTMGNQGKYAEAEQLHQHVLALSQKVLGPEHPETLASMHNVAQTMGIQGKYAEAEQLHRDVLALYQKVLGPEHPSTLTSMSNVAQMMSHSKYTEAEQLHRDLLALREEILGPEHPSTLTSMHEVAFCIGQQGKYVDAEKAYHKALKSKEKILGLEHPGTIATLKMLSLLLLKQNKMDELKQILSSNPSRCLMILNSLRPQEVIGEREAVESDGNREPGETYSSEEINKSVPIPENATKHISKR